MAYRSVKQEPAGYPPDKMVTGWSPAEEMPESAPEFLRELEEANHNARKNLKVSGEIMKRRHDFKSFLRNFKLSAG